VTYYTIGNVINQGRKGSNMTSISSFRKVAAAAFVGAAFMATSAQAATLVNHGSPLTYVVSATATSTGVIPPSVEFGPNGTTFLFDYVGGLVTFKLLDTDPDLQVVNYKLFNTALSMTEALVSFSLQDEVNTLFSYALSAGSYALKINADTSFSASTEVSAVPLPGAALLFGSTLLGYMGLSKRRKA